MNKLTSVALFFLLVTSSVSAQTTKSKKQDLSEIGREILSIVQRFEKATDKINFSRWDLPYGLQRQGQQNLDTWRNEHIPSARERIAKLQPTTSSYELFHLFVFIDRLGSTTGLFGGFAARFGGNFQLEKELLGIRLEAATVSNRLMEILDSQLLVEELNQRFRRPRNLEE